MSSPSFTDFSPICKQNLILFFPVDLTKSPNVQEAGFCPCLLIDETLKEIMENILQNVTSPQMRLQWEDSSSSIPKVGICWKLRRIKAFIPESTGRPDDNFHISNQIQKSQGNSHQRQIILSDNIARRVLSWQLPIYTTKNALVKIQNFITNTTFETNIPERSTELQRI